MVSKEAYQKQLETRLKTFEAEVRKLKARSNELSADARVKFEKQMDVVDQRLDTVEQTFSRLRKAGEDSWEDLRKGLGKATDELHQAFTRAAANFSAQTPIKAG